ncbi:hypothetical protein [Pseudomonas sp. NPDC096950]|uniref:hypothetical protein n=1 Tax=Pseudomonas sp. NPDC096950 TaxID=3364485 RepID=UPI00383BF353
MKWFFRKFDADAKRKPIPRLVLIWMLGIQCVLQLTAVVFLIATPTIPYWVVLGVIVCFSFSLQFFIQVNDGLITPAALPTSPEKQTN